MQRISIFAVYDKKAAAYLQPFYFPQKGQAIRAFEDSVKDPQSAFAKHPADYSLFKIGEYDDQTGQIKAATNPEFIEEAINLTEKN